MARPTSYGICTLLIVLVFLQDPGWCIDPPKECNNEASRFKRGDRYEFSYEAMTITGLTRDTHGTAGTRLTCNLILSAIRKCELTMELLNCHLDDRGPARFYSTTENSDTFSEELSRHQVYFQYDEGTVIDNQILISELEPLHILNIKRGIISLLQLPINSDDNENKSVLTHDIFGSCTTEVTFPEVKGSYVQTYRDLVACNLSHVSESQANFLSKSKTLSGGHRIEPITELSYPFESEVNCDYELGKQSVLKTARCLQRQAHIPLTYEDQYAESIVTNISQAIRFLSKTRIGNRPVDRSLSGKRLVKLAMEFEKSDVKYSSYDLEREVEAVMVDYIAQGQNNKIYIDHTAQSFRRLIQIIRHTNEAKIRIVKDAIFACRHSTLCYGAFNDKIEYNILQSIKERLLINSLMSCGTSACMNIVAESLKLKQIDKSEGNSILFNFALFHQPSSSFIRNIFEYCKHEHSSECLLAMSAMISRLNDSQESTVHRQVVGSIVFDVLTYLHKMIIENGMPLVENKLANRDRMVKEERLLAAVKSVGNIGMYVHKYYDGVLEGDKKVTVELLSLVKNRNISVSVARASVQAVSSFGLNKHVINEFLNILSDEKRPLVLRASIFDELLIQGDETVMMKLVKLLQDTQTENLRTYIVSKVSSLNEGLHTNYDQWRQKLYKLVEGLQLDEEDHIWSKSQHAHFSHTVVIPLTSLRMGGQVDLNILYAPTSNLFHSLSFKAVLKNGDKIWTSFEVVVDIEGMDDIVQLFKSKLQNNTDGSSIIKDIMSLLQSKFHHSGKTNTYHFTHYSKSVSRAIQHIIALSNVQATTLPRAYVFLRMNGYDMGWVSLNNCLATLSQMSKAGNLFEILVQTITQKIDKYLLHAVKPFDFQKVLPTVAGYPLSTTVDAAVVFKSILHIKNNPVPKRRLSLDVVFHPSITAFLQGSMQVTVAGYSTTNVASKISGFTAFDLTTNVQHHSVHTFEETDPFFSLTWKLGSEQVKFLNLKSDLVLMHNDFESKISTPEPEKKFVKCLPDIYNLITGRRFCLHGSYHGMSKSGFYNLMNAFRLSGTSAIDDEGLSQYTVQGHWKKTKTPGHQFKIQLAGLGTEVSRMVNLVVNIDNHSGFKLECSIPDAGVVYLFQHKNFFNSTHHHNVIASVLQQESKTLSSLLFERKGHSIPKVGLLSGDQRIPYNQSDSLVHFNIGLGGLSLDVMYRNRGHSATYSTKDFIVKYHCEPKLKFLYAFHPVIRLAATHDHTSTFALHQEVSDSRTPLEKTWKAFYKFLITWPDQTIETTTEMVANLQFADRITHLTWKYGNEVDEVHMTSHVTTTLTPEYKLFDYSLSVNNSGKFDIDLMGHVLFRGSMPFVNVSIRTDVRFMKQGDCANKIQKKKLVNSCQTADHKGKPLSLFDELQVSFLHWLRGCEYSLQNNCQKWLEKDRYLQWWKGCDLPELDSNCRVAEGSQASYSLKNSFWMLDSWNFGLDAQINVRPHRTTSIAGKEAGLLLNWETNSTWPKAAEKFVTTEGSLYMGKKQWIKFVVNDYIHDMMFTWQAEQLNTPEVFEHGHNWTLVETSHHSYDRSFKIHILLVHYQQFDYNMVIRSPRTNVTHYIKYTKISEADHEIRANATVHSKQPKFDINYLEATDIHGPNLATHIELFSTLLNYELNINKEMDRNGFKIAGNLSADSQLFGPQSKRAISTSLALQKNDLPRWDLVYSYGDQSGLDVDVVVTKPKQIRLSVNKLSMDKNKRNSNPFIALTIDLVEPKVLLHKLEFYNLSPTAVQQTFGMVQKSIAAQVRNAGKAVSHNIKADFKDKVWPILSESLAGYLKRKNTSSMAVDILNTLWLDIPLVQAVRVSHIDEALATCVQLATQGLSHWILHPPFFINHFLKMHVYPNLLESLEDKTFTVSQHLFVNMQTFLQFPKIAVAEKKLLTYIKHKLLSPYKHNDRDVALIVDGRRIKTFDGVVYDITEPPLEICTYLMSCDAKHGSFTLTYTRSGLTLSLHSFGLTLAHDGSIVSFGREHVDYLPYYSSDGHLHSCVRDGEFHLDIDRGLVHLIFNPTKSYYIIAVDRNLNNATLGLLGTNNYEKGDDFLLSNGTVLTNTIELQNGYELSRHSQCHISSPPASISCMTSNDQQCSLFSLPEIQPCNILINSQPFKLQCHVDVCQSQSECRSISAYIAACLTLGLQIPLPSHCQCGDKLGLEIVLVQSLYQKLIKANDPLLTVQNLLSTFETEVSIGVVTYGGTGQWRAPRAHLLNGKLFQKSTKFIHDIPFNTSQSLTETSAEEAITVATNYPFQSKHSKIVVLVYQHVAQKEEIKPSFISSLQSKGITLVAVSTYPSFEENQALGLLTDGKTIGTKNVTAPQDHFTSTVQETKGMWINLDAILGGQENQIRKIVYELTKLKSVHKSCQSALKDNQVVVDGPKQEV